MRCRRRLRWVVLLALLGGGAACFIRSRRRPQVGARTAPSHVAAPTTFVETQVGAGTAPSHVAAPTPPAPPTAAPAWVPPVDGQCPDGYPVKANDNSGIFHVPGGRFYARTVPERCYATEDDAAADGYRRAKA